MKAQAGEAGLKAKPHPGRGCQSPQDQDQLKQLLLQGSRLALNGAVDCGRVAQVIAQTFGVSYIPIM